MYRTLICLVTALTLAACASSSPLTASNVELSEGVVALLNSEEDISLSDPRIHCSYERKTGSHFRVRRCVTQREKELERRRSLRFSTQGRPTLGGKSGDN